MQTTVVQVVSAFALNNKTDLIRDDYHKLMRAFRALDPEKKGYIDAEIFGTLLSSRGEAFSSAETSTMLRYPAAGPQDSMHSCAIWVKSSYKLQ